VASFLGGNAAIGALYGPPDRRPKDSA
jgi:hypothetical protein